MFRSRHRKEATALWDDVLTHMPERHQQGRALIEARRRLIGHPNEAALSREIDKLAVAKFGPSQTAEIKRPAPGTPPRPPRKTEAEIADIMERVVLSVFETTVDGSPERAEYLRQRALADAEQTITNCRRDLGWGRHRRMRELARKLAQEMVDISTV